MQNLRVDLSSPFDEIQGLCEVAAKMADAPIALVSLIDDTRQNFLASVGVGDTRGSDRDMSICAHAIMGSQQFEVPDMLLDARFAENPFVVGTPGIRAYLATVLEPEPEIRIGTICLLDIAPKVYSDDVKASLSQIGQAITALLVSHRDRLDLIRYSEKVTQQNNELDDLTATLQGSMDKMIAAQKAKAEFVSIMNHELRTPLTTIKGSLSLMKSGEILSDRQKTRRLVGIAYDSSEKLDALVADILQFQKDGCSIVKTPLVPVDLSEVIETSAEAFRRQGENGLAALTVSGTGQPCIVNGDKAKLERALASILSNAVKFSRPGGKVEITLACDDAGPRIAVRDEGIGIPEGSREAVFGFFSQVDSSDTRSQSGTGLGMYICKQLLEQHDATIDYESEIGVGTTFTVQFPRLRLQ